MSNKFLAKIKNFFVNNFEVFRLWFNEKEHPRSRIKMHKFLIDFLWVIGLVVVFLILYGNSQSLNEIVFIFIKLGSLLQLIMSFFILKKMYEIGVNLRYGLRGLSNGMKIVLMFVLLLALLQIFLNQGVAIGAVKEFYNQTDFSTFNPVAFNNTVVNGTIVESEIPSFSMFTSFLPQPWGFFVFWGIVVGIVLFLIIHFVFEDESPGWFNIILIIVGIVLLFNLSVPYKSVEIGDYNTYCQDGKVMFKSNLFGLASWDMALSCIEYKSSRCRPLCSSGKPICQCEAVPIDIIFSSEGEWMLNG